MGSMELAIPIESDLKEINIEGYQSKFLAIVKNGLAKSNPTLFRYLYTTAKPKLFATSVQKFMSNLKQKVTEYYEGN